MAISSEEFAAQRDLTVEIHSCGKVAVYNSTRGEWSCQECGWYSKIDRAKRDWKEIRSRGDMEIARRKENCQNETMESPEWAAHKQQLKSNVDNMMKKKFGGSLEGISTIQSKSSLPPNPKQLYGDTKVNLSLVPSTAIIYAALGFSEGALKYGPFNWREKAVEAMTYIAALDRHVKCWVDGEDIDSESGMPHLGHAIACIAIIIDALECGNLIDNRPPACQTAELLKRWQKSDIDDSLVAEYQDALQSSTIMDR